MKKAFCIPASALLITAMLAGCVRSEDRRDHISDIGTASGPEETEPFQYMELTDEILLLADGLSAVRHTGDYGFDLFTERGGGSSDAEVVSFLTEYVLSGAEGLRFEGNPFGCSTLSVQNAKGDSLFGRNFDWNPCHAMIVWNVPDNGYASVSTVNTDFIGMSGIGFSSLPAETQALVALYAPLDGMNEMGLAVSVNMIRDRDDIEQNTDKPDLTTTTAVRLLLDKAASVEEAIELLRQYDMHASFGYMVHFAVADRDGNSVAVEYIDNEMVVVQTQAVTNFYLAEGEKHGIGTQQSHDRYELLMNRINASGRMEMNDVRDALDSVSKDNFGGSDSTEWSIVMNQSSGEIRYYHRENYTEPYVFSVKGGRIT